MPKARFIQSGESIDYTPSSAVKAGDVIVLGERVLIAKSDIAAGRLGALAAVGAFDVIKEAVAFAAGDPVYWNPSAGQAGTDPYAALLMGCAAAAASAEVPTVRVLLGPIRVDDSPSTGIEWNETPQDMGGNVWQLSQTPAPGKLLLFRNGLLQREGPENDFVATGRDLVFTAGNEPQPGDLLAATYLPL